MKRVSGPLARLIRGESTPRAVVYLVATLSAVATAALLGKDMGFDTLNYHLYAGFSALHDRFGQDYFPAGPQSYLNPYVYVPFYLLATSGLSAPAAAAVLAILQSGVLWLTFEIALQVSPAPSARGRVALAVCTLVLAFANPILISQFGSSYADITTSELVLGGWLLLLRAINRPDTSSIAFAGLLLGAASALKLTNSVHAVAATPLVLLAAVNSGAGKRTALTFVAGAAVAFVAVSAPWSLQLERHFGNPLFPFFNGVFRSPQFPTGSVTDYRFIPATIFEALRRPFDIMSPARMVDDEFPAADSRYALLLILAVVCSVGWISKRAVAGVQGGSAPGTRPLAALGGGFLLDWSLWLTASGNGRYFIPMACIAAVLIIALAYRALASWPKARAPVLAAMFAFQAILLGMGATLGDGVPWDGAAWFDVSIPAAMAATPALYFTYGEPSNSFIAPFLPKGAGLINIAGSYVLGPEGANGARIDSLIRRYSPHLRLILREPQQSEGGKVPSAALTYADDALMPFGLRADPNECVTTVVQHVAPGVPKGYLVSCQLATDPADQAAQSIARRSVDIIFDRLERACPDLFLPARPMTEDYSGGPYGRIWARRYPDTGLMALVGKGVVQIADRTRGGPATFVGLQSAWAEAPLRLECWRRDGRYHERILPAAVRRQK